MYLPIHSSNYKNTFSLCCESYKDEPDTDYILEKAIVNYRRQENGYTLK